MEWAARWISLALSAFEWIYPTSLSISSRNFWALFSATNIIVSNNDLPQCYQSARQTNRFSPSLIFDIVSRKVTSGYIGTAYVELPSLTQIPKALKSRELKYFLFLRSKNSSAVQIFFPFELSEGKIWDGIYISLYLTFQNWKKTKN